MKRIFLILLVLLQCIALCACGAEQPATEPTVVTEATEATEPAQASWESRPLNVIDDKYRTFYEVFVYSFYDSDGDGIGDLNGVRQKLDYIQELGFNGIWLMPIMPSTTYHKYDTTDYMDIDSEYGTLDDFKALLEDCHSRGIRVIIDLAMNHSSNLHPWFLEAGKYIRELPDDAEPDLEVCPYVDYYHFTKDPSGSGYSLVPGSTEWFYECQFWSGMPDLNLNSEAVRAEFEAIADFWLDMGVDGFRLDAVKEFESGQTETNIGILTWFNAYVKAKDENNYIVCECWEGKEIYAQYYRSGVDSMFDFSFGQSSGTIAKVLTSGKASSYGAFMVENQALYESYSETAINAPFYTNHDMGRTTGYYPGGEGEAKTKLGNAMNLMMTGNVFVYYGEELGMKGAGKDENKRAPMYWSKDEKAEGMCKGPGNMDDFEMKFDSLAEQAEDPDSIYNYVKKAILLRNQNPEIGRGEVTFHEAVSSDSICVISKTYEGRELLLIFNTTNTAQSVDLSSVTVQGLQVSQLSVLGELLTGEEAAAVADNTVQMPAFSMLLLGVED